MHHDAVDTRLPAAIILAAGMLFASLSYSQDLLDMPNDLIGGSAAESAPQPETKPVADEPAVVEPAIEPIPVEEPTVTAEPTPVAEATAEPSPSPVFEEPSAAEFSSTPPEIKPVAEEPVFVEPAIESAPVEEPAVTAEPTPVAETTAEPEIVAPTAESEPAPVFEEPPAAEFSSIPPEIRPVAEEPAVVEPAIEPIPVEEPTVTAEPTPVAETTAEPETAVPAAASETASQAPEEPAAKAPAAPSVPSPDTSAEPGMISGAAEEIAVVRKCFGVSIFKVLVDNIRPPQDADMELWIDNQGKVEYAGLYRAGANRAAIEQITDEKKRQALVLLAAIQGPSSSLRDKAADRLMLMGRDVLPMVKQEMTVSGDRKAVAVCSKIIDKIEPALDVRKRDKIIKALLDTSFTEDILKGKRLLIKITREELIVKASELSGKPAGGKSK